MFSVSSSESIILSCTHWNRFVCLETAEFGTRRILLRLTLEKGPIVILGNLMMVWTEYRAENWSKALLMNRSLPHFYFQEYSYCVKQWTKKRILFALTVVTCYTKFRLLYVSVTTHSCLTWHVFCYLARHHNVGTSCPSQCVYVYRFKTSLQLVRNNTTPGLPLSSTMNRNASGCKNVLKICIKNIPWELKRGCNFKTSLRDKRCSVIRIYPVISASIVFIHTSWSWWASHENV